MKKKNVLIAGGAGYIGSHMVRLILEESREFSPIVFDNLSTGYREFVPKGVLFIKGDLREKKDVEKVLKKYPVEAVMQFAASIVVPESVSNPLKYYENNVDSNINLLDAMIKCGVNKLIFSSTAAVYGEPEKVPVTEDEPTKPASPYGHSKLMVEQILKDTASAHDFRYVALRYFNVAGSHPSAETGIKGKVTHLIPSILKVLTGERKEFTIFGDDYPTPDGTCIRDFIYVMDLCRAHLLALKFLEKGMKSGIFNLGNGNGFSVKQVLDAAEKIVGQKVKTRLGQRRPGDPARIVASSEKAEKILGWKPRASLEEIVKSAWKWEQSQFKN